MIVGHLELNVIKVDVMRLVGILKIFISFYLEGTENPWAFIIILVKVFFDRIPLRSRYFVAINSDNFPLVTHQISHFKEYSSNKVILCV